MLRLILASMLLGTSLLAASANPDESHGVNTPPEDTRPSAVHCNALRETLQISDHVRNRHGEAYHVQADALRSWRQVYNALQSPPIDDADSAVMFSPRHKMRLMTGLIETGDWEVRFFAGQCQTGRAIIDADTFHRMQALVNSRLKFTDDAQFVAAIADLVNVLERQEKERAEQEAAATLKAAAQRERNRREWAEREARLATAAKLELLQEEEYDLQPGVHLTALCEVQLVGRDDVSGKEALLDDIRSVADRDSVPENSIAIFHDGLGPYYPDYALARTANLTIVFCTHHQFRLHGAHSEPGFHRSNAPGEDPGKGPHEVVFSLGTSQGCGTQCYYDGEYIVLSGTPIEELYITPVSRSAAGDYNLFEFEGVPFECTRRFQFLRSKIEVTDTGIRIHGALRASVTCGKKASACLFEMPYTEAVLEEGSPFPMFTNTRLRRFDPLETAAYRAFSDGAFWNTSWLNRSPSAAKRAWQEESAALCGAASARAREPSYRASVRELGATALLVDDERIPLN